MFQSLVVGIVSLGVSYGLGVCCLGVGGLLLYAILVWFLTWFAICIDMIF